MLLPGPPFFDKPLAIRKMLSIFQLVIYMHSMTLYSILPADPVAPELYLLPLELFVLSHDYTFQILSLITSQKPDPGARNGAPFSREPQFCLLT